MAVPAAAEPIFQLGALPVTNALLNGWIAVVFFVVIAFFLRKAIPGAPKKLQNVAEAVLEFLLGEMQKVTGDRERAVKFLPIVGTLFLFILFSNWLGLLPGTGSIGFFEMKDGVKELIPLLRPAASDLNLTLALALFVVITSHILGLTTVGPVEHLSKFVNIRGVLHALKKGPMAIMVAVIEFGVGLLEIISEFAKVLSLSLRLFGNVFAGEVLLTVMLGIFAYALPVPFLFMELLVGAIQATVFAMLTLTYFTLMTETHGHGEEVEEEAIDAAAHA
jgi:F-type H+-transporting ATPase subunit a